MSEFISRKPIDLSADWVKQAKELRARGKTWGQIAILVKKSQEQVRYAVDKKLRDRMLECKKARYAADETYRENTKWLRRMRYHDAKKRGQNVGTCVCSD